MGQHGQGKATERSLVGPCVADCNWIALPGGYWVSDPTCVQRIIRYAGIGRDGE